MATVCIVTTTGRKVYISWDNINIANGHKCVYRYGIAAERINLPCCYCKMIVTERVCTFMDFSSIEIVTYHVS